MLEKPNLADDDIIERLRQHHGIDVAALEFLPIGNDVGTYVYRVAGRDGATHFLKARRAPMYEPSVVVPHFLNAQGLHQVVSPLPTRQGGAVGAAGPVQLNLVSVYRGPHWHGLGAECGAVD
ncbi:MAG: hypothetical protein HC853_14450 [Anaerolineae bacterium]|nr:hypothetical protein [Anaerolineae bacterium]